MPVGTSEAARIDIRRSRAGSTGNRVREGAEAFDFDFVAWADWLGLAWCSGEDDIARQEGYVAAYVADQFLG